MSCYAETHDRRRRPRADAGAHARRGGDAPARGVIVQFQQDGDALPALPLVAIVALLVGVALATPNEGVLTKDRYDQVMTMHGTVIARHARSQLEEATTP